MRFMLHQPDMPLILAGLVVWAMAVSTFIFHRDRLKLRTAVNPDPDQRARDEFRLAAATGAAFVLFVVGTTVLALLFSTLTFADNVDLNAQAQAALAGEAAKVLAAIFMAVMIRPVGVLDPVFDPDRRPSRPGPLGLIALAAAIYLAIYPVVNCLLNELGLYVFERILELPTQPTHTALVLLKDPRLPDAFHVALIGSIVLATPLAEELFFRGFLQNLLLARFGRPTLAVVLTAAAFMAVHAPMYFQYPALFVLGLILGWAYYRFQTLALPVLIHMTFNAVTLLLWYLGAA